ncbi:hypothetical protein AN958_02928, partial [Leucoagaricus sp. SymC.cos]
LVVAVPNACQQAPVAKRMLDATQNAKGAAFDFPPHLSTAGKLGALKLLMWMPEYGIAHDRAFLTLKTCADHNPTRRTIATLNSSLDLALWAAAPNSLKGEWAKTFEVTPYLIEAFQTTLAELSQTEQTLHTQILDSDVGKRFRDSLTRCLFGYDALLRLRFRLSVADFTVGYHHSSHICTYTHTCMHHILVDFWCFGE